MEQQLQQMKTQKNEGPILAYKSCDFIPAQNQHGALGVVAELSGLPLEENMFVTAGDSIQVLNSKDVIFRTFNSQTNVPNQTSSVPGN